MCTPPKDGLKSDCSGIEGGCYTEIRSSGIATVSSIREPSAGLPPSVASHSLRHSIAVHSLEEGFGLEYVADLLGHASIRSTAIYARITSRGRDPR
jgi:site-specific recombinase XerD